MLQHVYITSAIKTIKNEVSYYDEHKHGHLLTSTKANNTEIIIMTTATCNSIMTALCQCILSVPVYTVHYQELRYTISAAIINISKEYCSFIANYYEHFVNYNYIGCHE